MRRPRLGQWTNASFRSHVQSIIPKSAHRVARSTTTRRHCRLTDPACSGSHTCKLCIKKIAFPVVIGTSELDSAEGLVASTAPSRAPTWRRRQRQAHIYTHRVLVARCTNYGVGAKQACLVRHGFVSREAKSFAQSSPKATKSLASVCRLSLRTTRSCPGGVECMRVAWTMR